MLGIGAGTGQLTRPPAVTGCRAAMVGLGPSPAGVARRHLAAHARAEVVLAAHARAEVVVGDIDRWALRAEPFDVRPGASSSRGAASASPALCTS